MRILIWHVHGSWATSFVQGAHDYVLPVLPDRGPDGRGRARTWDWPRSAVERTPDQLRNEPLDLVVLQRPHEAELAATWTGRTPGVDIPAVYVEHDAPHPHPTHSSHPFADQSRVPIVHVTWFNQMFWDNGRAPVRVVEHGIPDPGARYTGELRRAAVVINEPVRRARTVGTDLLPELAAALPLDHFGWADGSVPGADHAGDLGQDDMLTELARRRVYLHPNRWTSLGLSLIEAMHLAMPIVAVAATEVPRAVGAAAGVVSARPDELTSALRRFADDPELARATGKAARERALEHYSLARFQRDWDELIHEVTR